ncbi:MAG: hypothetical protein JKX85_12425 [Phycisphaeraceae bacterium]|nr:hypothetical protein [Phycisphaeraceae bacterium]
MINKQHIIKAVAILALGVVLYTLRPMPQYDLYARTAAGMYEQNHSADEQTITALFRQTAILAAELNSAMALLDMRILPDQAKVQLSQHLTGISSASWDMQQQLIEQFTAPRISEMINLPLWATQTVALAQVLQQNKNHDTPNKLTDSKLHQLKSDLQWAQQSLADLRELLRREMPAFKIPAYTSTPLN